MNLNLWIVTHGCLLEQLDQRSSLHIGISDNFQNFIFEIRLESLILKILVPAVRHEYGPANPEHLDSCSASAQLTIHLRYTVRILCAIHNKRQKDIPKSLYICGV
jgi:hypothetical protein